MIVILCLCLLAVPLTAGNGICHVLYGRDQSAGFWNCDALLAGWTAVIGIGEATHLAAAFFGFSLDRCCLLFGGLILALTGASAAFLICRGRKNRGKSHGNSYGNNHGKRDGESRGVNRAFSAVRREGAGFFLAAAVGLFLLQMGYLLFSGNVYVGGDITAETVAGFLADNGVYQTNPLTGLPYSEGLPERLRILCLPTLYSVLCRMFSLTPRVLLWRVIPCFTLILCYCAYSCVGRCLFPDSPGRRYFFLAAVGLLLWVSCLTPGMDGFGVLFCGYRGVVFRNAVLVPWLFSLWLRQKRKLTVLCMLAEICLVWTLYGAGVCLLITAGLFAVELVLDRAGGPRRKGEAS